MQFEQALLGGASYHTAANHLLHQRGNNVMTSIRISVIGQPVNHQALPLKVYFVHDVTDYKRYQSFPLAA